MISMKRKPSKSPGVTEVAVSAHEEYPYGLEISLDDESLKKLGMEGMPAIGSTSILTAKVKVTSVSESASENGKDRYVRLQITEMELGTGTKTTKSASLYE